MKQRGPKLSGPCLANVLRRCAGADGGNVGVFAALALLAIILCAGSAIDYARLLATQTALAASTDAAALQVGNSELTAQEDLEALAEDVVDNNYNAERYGDLIDLDLSINGDTVDLTTTVLFRTAFMKLVGIEEIELPVSSQVKKSGNNLEISLVLDVTGSMAGNRINTLKQAASDFVNTVVWDDQDLFYSKVALVPYSSGVNLGSAASTARGTVSSGTCTSPGCSRYRFRNARGANRTLNISNCVSERTGTEAYTDVSPSSARMGRNYASPNNPCLSSELEPLTADKDTLLEAIDDLRAEGSTAGQIGIAWGWYALSKDVGMWSGDNEPAEYDAERVSKIAVIMTDGEFNTAYCNGVISRSSGNGSGSADDKIDCDATNGSSNSQATLLCDAMKAKGIVIYTIGFDVGDDEDVTDMLTDCATSVGHAYLAATNQELQDVFAEIGKKVTALRLSL